MRRRFLSLLLAVLAVMSVCVPAYADDEPAEAAEELQSTADAAAEEFEPALDGVIAEEPVPAQEEDVLPALPDGAASAYWQRRSRSWYYYIDGVLQTGWLTIPGDGTYYLDTNGGAMLSGWHWLGDRCYYFDYSGRMVTGWVRSGRAWYYLDADGAMHTGFLTIPGDGTYYLDPYGGAMATGWKWIGDAWYYFNSSGRMETGWVGSGSAWYYIGADGKMMTGWFTIDGIGLLYTGPDGARTTGWRWIGDAWYYFNEHGAMQTGWICPSGTWYYLDENGRMVTGWRDFGDGTHYFDASGAAHNGPTYISGEMYLFSDSGVVQRNTDVYLCGKWYHVNEYGMIEGYVTYGMRQAAAVLDQIGWNLQSAFWWSAGLTYYSRWTRADAGSVHTEWYANYGFTNRRGNCYVMNATLYQMAKVLGYEVYFVEGYVASRNGYMAPHGWTEIILDGTTYVFDANFTNETGRNGYQIWYGKSGTWRYASYSRVA